MSPDLDRRLELAGQLRRLPIVVEHDRLLSGESPPPEPVQRADRFVECHPWLKSHISVMSDSDGSTHRSQCSDTSGSCGRPSRIPDLA